MQLHRLLGRPLLTLSGTHTSLCLLAFLAALAVTAVTAVAIHGSVAATRAWQAAEPVRLEEVGRLGGEVTALAAAGDLAYIGAGWTLQSVDLAAPNGPRIVNQVGLGAHPQDMAVANGHLFVALGGTGLRVFSLAEPARPKAVAAVPAREAVRRVVALDGLAYLVDGDDGGINVGSAALRVLDLADPTQPRGIGTVTVQGNVVDLAIGNRHVFLATEDYFDTVTAVDVSDPVHPRPAGSLRLGDCANCLAAIAWAEDRVFVVGNGYLGLVVVDASDPRQLRRLGRTPLPEPGQGQVARGADLVVSAGQAYVGGRSGLYIYDLQDPTVPRYLAALEDAAGERLAVSDDRLLTARAESLNVVSLADPVAPTLEGSLRLLGQVSDALGVVGQNLLIGKRDQLVVLDLADPVLPRETARLPLVVDWQPYGGANANDLVVGADRSYLSVAGFADGRVDILDLRAPGQPRRLGVVRTRAVPGRMALYDTHLYVAEGFEGPVRPGILEVLDVTDPANPRVQADLDMEGAPAVVGGHLVLVNAAGVRVYDLTDPLAPHLIGSLDVAVASRLHDGSMLYVTSRAAGSEALLAVDLTDPTAPREVGRLTGAFPAIQAKLGPNLLLGWYDSGVQVVDVSDPVAPREVPGAAWPRGEQESAVLWSLVAHGDLAYVAGSFSGLIVLRLLNAPPTATPPTRVTATPTPTVASPTASASPSMEPAETAVPTPSTSAVANASPTTTQAPITLPWRLFMPTASAGG